MAIQQVDGALSIVVAGKEYLLMPYTRGANIENDTDFIDALTDSDELLVWDASDSGKAKKTTWGDIKASIYGGVVFPQIVVSTTAGAAVTVTDGTTAFNGTATGGKIIFNLSSYGTWTVTAAKSGTVFATEVVQVDAVKKHPVNLYESGVIGVCWNTNNPSTALSRLTTSTDPNGYVTVNITAEPIPAVGTGSGSSPFDRYMPWAGMDEFNIVNNAIGPKKGEAGFSRQRDTVVYIPEFYFKITESGGKRYFYIADKPRDGFAKHPGSGKYLGRYATSDDKMSRSGAAPWVSMEIGEARSSSMAKGDKWSQYDYATWCAVWLLYIVEFADWDSQSRIGRGIVDKTWAEGKDNTGGTDSMTYHTGRAAGTNGRTAVQYRHLENLWGNVFQWVDGITYHSPNDDDNDVYICLDYKKYANETTEGYQQIATGIYCDDWISSLALPRKATWAFIPTGGSGSETTYIPDYACGSTDGWYCLYVGGYWGYGDIAGLFRFDADNGFSDSYSNIGARLLFHP